jgi:hypothetical protein
MLNFDVVEQPSHNIVKEETEHLLLSFCTLCTLLKGKKLSIQNVFILVLQEERLRNILKELLSVDTNFEVVKLFINYDPLISVSKYVTKFLNSNSSLKL